MPVFSRVSSNPFSCIVEGSAYRDPTAGVRSTAMFVVGLVAVAPVVIGVAAAVVIIVNDHNNHDEHAE